MVDAVSTWELNDALSHDDREVRRTNHGVVTQIDDDGQIWVRLAGADEDTPIAQTTVSVDAGDSVTVRIQDGRAYIDGSTSNPSASSSGLANVDGKAMQALTDAATAAQAAIEAVADAATARQAATEAVESAETAQEAADDAQNAADAAQVSADDAREAADKAIFSLTDLENVVGTVNWIAEHGEYVLTEDTAIVDGKPYYTRSGTSPDYIYTVVAEPVASELSTYYELHLDESVQNFLASHIWLDQYGLNIAVSNTNAYRIHQGTVDGTKTVGMYVIDASGNIVADFTASGAQIGKSSSTHVNIDSDSLDLIDGSSNVLATFGASSATIGKTSGKRAVFNQSGMSIYDGSKFCMSVGGASYGTTTVAGLYLGREVPAIETVGTGYFHLYNEGADFVMDTDGTFKFGINSSITTASISASSGSVTSKGQINVRDSSINRDATTIAEDHWATSYFRCQDKDGDVIAVLRNAQRTTGRMDTFLYVYNDDTTGEGYTDNYIRISVARDGTRTYAVGDPSAFRNALGLGSLATKSSVAAGSEITGTLGKGNGGTGKTNTDTTYYGAKSLFSGTATTGTVTLSETAANYSMLLIQYRDNDSNYSSKLIISPNGKKVVLDMVYGVSGVGNLKSRTVTISGTSITTVSGSTMDAAHNGGAGTTNHIYITQVWGWK